MARQAYAHVISLHPDSPEAELAEQSMVWLDSEAPWDSDGKSRRALRSSVVDAEKEPLTG